MITDMLRACMSGEAKKARKTIRHLWRLGYAPQDIIGMVSRMIKSNAAKVPEHLQLLFLQV